jgi:hypothetical protein
MRPLVDSMLAVAARVAGEKERITQDGRAESLPEGCKEE